MVMWEGGTRWIGQKWEEVLTGYHFTILLVLNQIKIICYSKIKLKKKANCMNEVDLQVPCLEIATKLIGVTIILINLECFFKYCIIDIL